MQFLKRSQGLARLQRATRRSPITALVGPRQCGKTTLAKQLAATLPETHFLDLESQRDQARLQAPQMVLEKLRGLVILDEVQHMPTLFPLLRVLADRRPSPCRFLILGSASPSLLNHSAESLAGRVEFIELSGLSLNDVGKSRLQQLWARGGFPRSYLSQPLSDSQAWRENFIRTFLQRDLPQLGIRIPAPQLQRFWRMIAHLHGNLWNSSEIAGSLGVSHPTTKHYLDLLTDAFMLRQLPPWYQNLGKRLVKTPKVYIRDSGLLHALLGVWSFSDIQSHPKYGFSWEGFSIEQILSITGENDAYFWATHSGAELDLLLLRRGKRWGFEFKTNDAPTITRSMRSAIEDLELDHLWIVYPGSHDYPLDKKVDCIGLNTALQLKEIR